MKFSILRISWTALLLAGILAACTQTYGESPLTRPTYDPFMPLDGAPQTFPTFDPGAPPATPYPSDAPFIVPTAIPLDQLVPRLRPAGQPFLTPTPDAPHRLPTPRSDQEKYVVQPGDMLGDIADSYGIGIDALMQANGLTDPNVLDVGQILVIPVTQPELTASAFKIVPDSELVYGPASVGFDVADFIQQRGGYLSVFAEDVNGEFLTAAQIVMLVAENYSVNPRLLLALIEHRSGWVTNSFPAQTDFALGIADPSRYGLYYQLTYAADELNRGYYLWRANAIASVVLADGSVAPIDPTVNAGTVGVQQFFAKLDDRVTWQSDVGSPELNPASFYNTYFLLFGQHPFDFAVEPLVPSWLHQPRMALPFERGVTWYFTGGPHGAWENGYALAALDFVPFDYADTWCQSEQWITTVTSGLIVRSGNGQVILDIDSDGFEQTGWVVLFLHVEDRDRIEAGLHVKAGDLLGHPSCKGGNADATHLHLARKYNGEWISADGHIPFVMDNWVSSGTGVEYDGFLTRGNVILEALEAISELNMIQR